MSNKRINKKPTTFVQQLSSKKDSSKMAKNIKSFIIMILVFVVVIFSLSYYAVNKHNSIRKTVESNPKTISAEVIEISVGKGVHSATYEFTANGKKYTGSTFQTYYGNNSDVICVKYSTIKPEINIYCEDTTPETFFDDVFIYTLEIAGVGIGFLFVWLLFLKFKNTKK